jgi:hypothetical protein
MWIKEKEIAAYLLGNFRTLSLADKTKLRKTARKAIQAQKLQMGYYHANAGRENMLRRQQQRGGS